MTDEVSRGPGLGPVRFIDDPRAPDIYIDEAVGLAVHKGIVKVTLGAAHIDHSANPGPVNLVVVGRLVMSVAAAQNLSVQLFNFLKLHGLGQNPPSATGRAPRVQ